MPFSIARACGEYAGALEANVLFLKSAPHLCRRLRQVVAQTYSSNRTVLESDVIIPVPLHAARKQERGFNQAEVIAQAVAADFHLELDTDLLGRTKNTERHRAGMDEIDRAKSVERAFKVRRPESLKNRSVLLVDDVFTTGHTISAAAQTLLARGATHVKVLTIARVRHSFHRL
jgi:ComF family protein